MTSAPPVALAGPPNPLGPRATFGALDALFVIACFVVAFWDLAGRSLLFEDVSRFGVVAREMLRSGEWLVPTKQGEIYANKPILYIWAVAGPSALFGGVTDFWVRLPSALAFVAMAWSTAAWATVRSGSKSVGRLAGLFVLSTYFVHLLGRTGRPDMLAAGLATVGAMLIDRTCSGRGRPRDWLWAGLALGGSLLAKGPTGLLVPLALVAWPRAGIPFRERLARTRPLTVLAVAIATALFWLVPATLHGGVEYVRRLVVDQVADRVQGAGNHIEPLGYYGPALLIGGAPWSILYIAAAIACTLRRVRAALGDTACVAAFAGGALVLSLVPTKQERYLLPLVPPAAVAAAQGVGALAKRWRLLLPVATVAAGGMALTLSIYWTVHSRNHTVERDVENAAVAAVLVRDVPSFVVAQGPGQPLLLEDLYYGAPDAVAAATAEALPARGAARAVQVVCLDTEVDAVRARRGEPMLELLRRPRKGGGLLVVLRSPPP